MESMEKRKGKRKQVPALSRIFCNSVAEEVLR
jgi:hypothetical protein